MWAYIKGNVLISELDYIVVDNNNMGYKINGKFNVSVGSEVSLYLYTNVREDEITLYGFINYDQYQLFTKLISVKGLGPKIASNIISSSKVNDLLLAIQSEDIKFIKTLPGIGNKVASQIILDLKGKLVSNVNNDIDNNAIDALEGFKAMGYKSVDITLLKQYFTTNKCDTVEEYMKIGLKMLGGK